MMKILLVFAGITETGFNNYGFNHEGSWIHHGLCSISACLKKEGYHPELIDLRRLKNEEDFAESIRKKNPDIVGLTMMSLDYNYVMKSVEIIKMINPKIITIVGGPHPSIKPEEVLSNKNIDYVIKGEGEISFIELLKDIESGRQSKRLIQGISPDLNQLLFIDRELFAGFEVPVIPDFLSPFVTLIAGRGCRYNCNFCQPAERFIFGDRVRRRTVDNVISELKQLKKKYNFRSFMFHDDCLLEDINWCMEFSKRWKALGYICPFACQSRVDIIYKNENVIKQMAEAGLKLLLIGFESGSQRILNFLNKGTTVTQNLEAGRICKKYGIKIWANYMMGIPTETKKEVWETVKMLCKIKPDHYSLAYYTPHPGSALYEYVMERNLSLIKNYEDYRRNPIGPKIKGIDYNFLQYANLVATIEQSQDSISFLIKRMRQVYKKEGSRGLNKRIMPFLKRRIKIWMYQCNL